MIPRSLKRCWDLCFVSTQEIRTNDTLLVTPLALGWLANRNTQSSSSTTPNHCTFNFLGMGSKTFPFVHGLPRTHSYDIFSEFHIWMRFKSLSCVRESNVCRHNGIIIIRTHLSGQEHVPPTRTSYSPLKCQYTLLRNEECQPVAWTKKGQSGVGRARREGERKEEG